MKKSLLLALSACTLLNAAAPAVLPAEKRTFSQSQYVPDISAILDASFASRSKDQDELAGLGIPGITEAYYGEGEEHEEHEEHGHSHGAYSPDNGFNLQYVELVLSANVDPNFSLDAVFHFNADSVEAEEVYFTNTTALDGLRIRGGKLLSEMGRLNQQHHHFWDFNEQPLIYQAFVGNEGLNELGLQLQYTLPFEEYVMIGGEVLQGTNEKSYGNGTFSVTSEDGNTTEDIKGADAPSLFVGYVKGSFDIGNTSVLPGVSYVYGESRSLDAHDDHTIGFDGTSAIINAELTVKHFFDSYSFLTWQSEWMQLEKKGDEYHAEADDVEKLSQKITQAGYYTQLVYAPNQNWRMGGRYESIYENDNAAMTAEGETLPDGPYDSYAAMVEYHWSEFSRLRLEYTHNDALYREVGDTFQSESVDTVLLSINLAIGAHAAHDF
jgi:hypothetical protein